MIAGLLTAALLAGSPTAAMSVQQADQLLEGVAYDAKTKRVLVGSVRHRNLLVLDGQGGARELTAEGAMDVGGFFGMAVEARTRTLWVATTWLPQVNGYTPAKRDAVALLRLSLDGVREGKTSVAQSGGNKVFALPADGKRHAFGDVALSPKSEVFVSDSLASAIYVLKGDALELWLTCPFRFLQGLAFSSDGKTLYAAGYADGLFAIDVATKAVRPLKGSEALKGIDAVVRWGDQLVVTQNQSAPMKVLVLTLAGDSVKSVKEVLTNHPLADDLSLAAVAGDRLYLVGQAGWAAFGDDGQPTAGAPAARTVLELSLR